MCSSMAMYSKPFCKNVINAPGGISVWAVLDFTTSDSCAKVNAEWENPVLVRTRGVSGAINIDWSVFACECCSPFSDKYRKIKKFTSSEEMLISSSQPKYITEIKSKAGNKARIHQQPALWKQQKCMHALQISIRIYKCGNKSTINNYSAGYFLRIITCTTSLLFTLYQCWYRAKNREIKKKKMTLKKKRNCYSRGQHTDRRNFSRKHLVTHTNRSLNDCQLMLKSYSKSKYYKYQSLIISPETN